MGSTGLPELPEIKAQPARRNAMPWVIALVALSVVIDRLTKLWVHAHVPMGGGITIIPRVFRISNVINTGAAFSLFTDSLDPLKVRYALVAFSILAIVVVSVMLARAGRYFNSTSIGLALILGGAIGNLYDRVKLHYVIDFLEVHIINYHWPDFNVADSCICIGACLLMFEVIRPQAER